MGKLLERCIIKRRILPVQTEAKNQFVKTARCALLVPRFFYLQNMNATGFRACLKELYETRYDPVSVSYVVLAGELARNVAFLMQQNLMS